MAVEPYHFPLSQFYHIHPGCTLSDNQTAVGRLDGTGDKPLCPQCNERSLADEVQIMSRRLEREPLTLDERFQVYQVAVEAILTKMLETMPDDDVDHWLTNDSNILLYKIEDKENDAKAAFYRLVFGRIRQQVGSRRARRTDDSPE